MDTLIRALCYLIPIVAIFTAMAFLAAVLAEHFPDAE
jgi:hypothetical protein